MVMYPRSRLARLTGVLAVRSEWTYRFRWWHQDDGFSPELGIQPVFCTRRISAEWVLTLGECWQALMPVVCVFVCVWVAKCVCSAVQQCMWACPMHMNKHNEGLQRRKIVGGGWERSGGINEKPIDVLACRRIILRVETDSCSNFRTNTLYFHA